MPYIPSPPRPPGIHTPSHNIHLQNQQRSHQQQRVQQQQQRLQEQQQRLQEQQRRCQQNIQMDSQRRHQQQQQQLQRQQQALQFQRQQEQFRRQQQDSLYRQQEQRRQQEFLRNFQRSPSGFNGATVVNISPSVQQHQPNGNGEMIINLESTNGLQDMTNQAMTDANPTQLTQNEEAPPNYPSPKTRPRALSREPPDNAVALKDGTIIVLRNKDEILFKGPTGVEMIVNCLPLYEPSPRSGEQEREPKREEQEESSGSAESSPDRSLSPLSPDKSRKSFSLIKARSVDAIDTVAAELEIHDRDTEESKSEENLVRTSIAPRKWSRMSNSYAKNLTVMVREELPKDVIGEAPPWRNDEVNGEKKETERSDGRDFDETNKENSGLEAGNEPQASAVEEEDVVKEKSLPTIMEPQDDDDLTNRPKKKRSVSNPPPKKPLRDVRSSSPVPENGSEEESEGTSLTVNFLDKSAMSTLTRSSGSVSFMMKLNPQPTRAIMSQDNACALHTKSPLLKETRNQLSQEDAPPSSSHLTSFPEQHTTPNASTTPSVQMTPSLLPLPPSTLDPDYIERSGWLNKLSHRKGVFGDKWQKRYFVLHRSWLYYFKKYGDSNPRGAVRLLPSGWSRGVSQGTMRMSDAVLKSNEQMAGIISVLRCLAVHRPSNFSASLCDLLATDGVAETFRSQTIAVTNSQHLSRTYYMVAPSNNEREEWVKCITKNMQAYAFSSEALTTACKELKIMLRAVNCNIAPKHIPSLLYLLHTKQKFIKEKNLLSS